MTEPEFVQLDLGERLRRSRESRGLDRTALSRSTGLPEDAIAAFESGEQVPAIGDLVKIASVLNLSLARFFQRAIAAQRVEVVHARDRWSVQPQSEAARTLGYRYQALSYNLSEKLMSPFLVEIPPSTGGDAPASKHDGEEFLFVLAGQLEVTVGGEVHRLVPGDSIYFDSRLEHALRAVEGAPVRLLACIAEARRPGVENPIDRAYS